MEIRAWTGWEESALFAWELARAYLVFAESEWFKTEIVEQSESENWWFREIIFEVKWDWAYRKFKYEAGTHRVQRIPETESKWRVHTSAITVAILPEVEEVDVEIREQDLEIKACRASWAGWQHVNKQIQLYIWFIFQLELQYLYKNEDLNIKTKKEHCK